MRKRKKNRYIEELDRLGRRGMEPVDGRNECQGFDLKNKEPDSGNNSYEEEEVIDLLPYEPDPEEALRVLHDLYVGIMLFSLMILAAGMIFVEGKLAFALGVFLGGGGACAVSFHMYRSLDVALELPKDAAVKYIRKRTGIRMLFMGILVGISCVFSEYLNVCGVVFGLLTLKFSAYLQPVIHIFTTIILKRKVRM